MPTSFILYNIAKANMLSYIFIVLLLTCSCLANRKQAVGVKGRLMCDDKPAARVSVKLWEEDHGTDRDDLLDQAVTDDNGNFKLQGYDTEATDIEPVFKIYHDCDNAILPGKRKVKFLIPYQYIYNGTSPKKLFDIGLLNLETIFPKEERKLAGFSEMRYAPGLANAQCRMALQRSNP
ncbi:unnamed protein product [Cylicocyclus nassatus]|uniref:Transthyretin-like family protein n=1 Tax=Cylicocyclus nassatus TaxID=53992 RepID=A0AA36M8M7_CYLNA|nr:unnamed protein product [Cylicocyclus nassatus]